MKMNSLLKNKYLYYVASVLMVINVFGYVSMGSIECVLVFGAAAYASQHFTNNKSLQILGGLFAANILFGCGRIKEGLASPQKKVDDVCATLSTEAKCLENSTCSYKSGKCAQLQKQAVAQAAVLSNTIKQAADASN